MLLAALLVGMGIPALNALTASRLRTAAGQMAGMAREAYARAAITGKPHRIVLDIDEGTFRLEWAPTPFVLHKERARQLTEAENKDRKAGKDAADAPGGRSRLLATREADLDESERIKRDLEKPPEWVPVEDELGQPHKLPEDCGFEKVWVAHQSEPFSRGQSLLHFWSSGHTETAIIRLTDDVRDHSRVISVKINGLTGRAIVADRKLEFPNP